MARHLRFSCYGAHVANQHSHPQLIMDDLGIKWQHATPQSIADQWWFWNCENVPDILPEFITDLNLDPMKQIGWGLSEDKAIEIRDYEKT